MTAALPEKNDTSFFLFRRSVCKLILDHPGIEQLHRTGVGTKVFIAEFI